MSNSREELTGALVGLGATITEAMNEIEGFVPCGNPAAVTNSGLIMLKSYASEEEIAQQTHAIEAFIDHVSEHRGVTAHEVANTSAFVVVKTELLSALSATALSLQAVDDHQPEIMEWVYRSLASLEDSDDRAAGAMLAKHEDIERRLNELTA